ncbi:MAG: hypothetical protein ACXACW_11265 [Candidatus Hodarchaeales archaeon]|jgi:hypothetical protein
MQGKIATVVDIAPTSAHYSSWKASPVPFKIEIGGVYWFPSRFAKIGYPNYCSISFRFLDGKKAGRTGSIFGALLQLSEPDWEI